MNFNPSEPQLTTLIQSYVRIGTVSIVPLVPHDPAFEGYVRVVLQHKDPESGLIHYASLVESQASICRADYAPYAALLEQMLLEQMETA